MRVCGVCGWVLFVLKNLNGYLLKLAEGSAEEGQHTTAKQDKKELEERTIQIEGKILFNLALKQTERQSSSRRQETNDAITQN